ncbi:MAG TPA: hypothetical protein DGG94_14500 [Micromonosporaceae bacterium]|nr:hypothetical protein [Micromonosporaceae bacterium]HCU50983.1 hypothetical protein [Micromonosporaceae bacterium]
MRWFKALSASERALRGRAKELLREQERAELIRFDTRLKSAAGIGMMTVVCHSHTFDYIERTGKAHHSWVPTDPERVQWLEDDLVRFPLSGPQIVVLLSELMMRGDIAVSRATVSFADQAMCTRLYHLLGAAVDSVSPSAGSAPPALVIADMVSADLDPQD